MSLVSKVTIKCLCCGEVFQSRKVTAIDTLGPATSDFFEMSVGEQPIRHLVHTCPECGYTGVLNEKGPLQDDIIKVVAKEITPRIGQVPVSTWRRWEFMAIISRARGLDDFAVGSLYLRAAWSAWLDKEKEAEDGYREAVIRYFEKALRAKVVLEDRVYWTTYLVGEMHRRLGNRRNAKEWYNKVLEMQLEHPDRNFWIDLATQQMTEPKEYLRAPAVGSKPEDRSPSFRERLKMAFRGLTGP